MHKFITDPSDDEFNKHIKNCFYCFNNLEKCLYDSCFLQSFDKNHQNLLEELNKVSSYFFVGKEENLVKYDQDDFLLNRKRYKKEDNKAFLKAQKNKINFELKGKDFEINTSIDFLSNLSSEVETEKISFLKKSNIDMSISFEKSSNLEKSSNKNNFNEIINYGKYSSNYASSFYSDNNDNILKSKKKIIKPNKIFMINKMKKNKEISLDYDDTLTDESECEFKNANFYLDLSNFEYKKEILNINGIREDFKKKKCNQSLTKNQSELENKFIVTKNKIIEEVYKPILKIKTSSNNINLFESEKLYKIINKYDVPNIKEKIINNIFALNEYEKRDSILDLINVFSNKIYPCIKREIIKGFLSKKKIEPISNSEKGKLEKMRLEETPETDNIKETEIQTEKTNKDPNNTDKKQQGITRDMLDRKDELNKKVNTIMKSVIQSLLNILFTYKNLEELNKNSNKKRSLNKIISLLKMTGEKVDVNILKNFHNLKIKEIISNNCWLTIVHERDIHNPIDILNKELNDKISFKFLFEMKFEILLNLIFLEFSKNDFIEIRKFLCEYELINEEEIIFEYQNKIIEAFERRLTYLTSEEVIPYNRNEREKKERKKKPNKIVFFSKKNISSN